MTNEELNSIDTYKFFAKFNIENKLKISPKDVNYYTLTTEDSDSLMISPRGLMFYKFSTNEKGGAFDLLRRIGYTTSQASKMLNDYLRDNNFEIVKPLPKYTKQTTNPQNIIKERKYHKPFAHSQNTWVIAKNYLLNRGLSEGLIDYLRNKNYISSCIRKRYDDDKNLVDYYALQFNIFEDGILKGQAIHKITTPSDSLKYKRFFTNGDVFTFKFKDVPKNMYIFESEIDLFSYILIKGKDNDGIYISIFGNGTHLPLVDKYVTENIKKIICCTDNDSYENNIKNSKVGDKTYELICERYNEKVIEIVRDKPNKKDWNEELKITKNKEREY